MRCKDVSLWPALNLGLLLVVVSLAVACAPTQANVMQRGKSVLTYLDLPPAVTWQAAKAKLDSMNLAYKETETYTLKGEMIVMKLVPEGEGTIVVAKRPGARSVISHLVALDEKERVKQGKKRPSTSILTDSLIMFKVKGWDWE